MNKKNVLITLYVSELVYDIENKTFLTGRSRENGDNHEEVANMQANDDDENLNQVLRSIGNAFAALKTKLSEYLDEDAMSGANELLSDETETLSLPLQMPTNYNNSTIDTITAAMHQYVVNTAIGEWFTITNKTDAGDYISLAGQNLSALREALNKRIRPTRRNAGDNSSRFRARVATPLISMSGDRVSMSCATAGATIYYTTDGTIPTSSSSEYSESLELGTGRTVHAYAVHGGMSDSAVAEFVVP